MSNFKILSNRAIAEHTYELVLTGAEDHFLRPGQFANFLIPGYFLRRPISLCEKKEDRLRFIYKVLGKGTQTLSQKTHGSLDVLTGLGNGFDPDLAKEKTAVLVGGGVGVPPLFGLAKALRSKQISVQVFLGFNKKEEIFLAEEFEELGCTVTLATLDGSRGQKGLVTEPLEAFLAQKARPRAKTESDRGEDGASMSGSPDVATPARDRERGAAVYLYTCGPSPMLKAVFALANQYSVPASFSLEERMGCGFGACMGCSIPTREGAKRLCKDGPVFSKEVLAW